MKKVALYARVSTTDQDQTTQKEVLKDYCKRNNITHYSIYEDIYTGASDSRTQFNKLMDDVRNGTIDTVIVYKLDRLGRSLKHLLQLMEEFKNRKVNFISITQNFNTNTPEGKMMQQMMMVLAEYERELTVARTRETLERYKRDLEKQGFYIGRDGKRHHSLGRPPGKKDTKERRKSGYYQRWANEK